MKLAIITSHPIQYQAPWFRELAKQVEVKVWFAFQPDAKQQGEGFGKEFTWDVDLLSGYEHEFLTNVAKRPGTDHFGGCDTPEVGERLKDGDFDAVILCGWHLKSFIQAWKACRRLGIPVLVRGDSQLRTPRSLIKKWLKVPLYRFFLSGFDGFLSVGERNRAYLRHYGVPERKIFFAPHFVDNEWFSGRAEEARVQAQSLREEWGDGEWDLVVGFVGKFEEKKRPEDLLKAVAFSKVNQQVRPVFIGAGPLEGRLRTAADALGIDVVFAGFKNQTELPACYAALDVLVLPSSSETWGLVVNEAMACGTPVFVSDACGCAPDLIEEGNTGFIFPMGDTAAMAQLLHRFFELKRAKHKWRPALQEKLRQYSVKVCVEGTLEAIRVVTAAKSRVD